MQRHLFVPAPGEEKFTFLYVVMSAAAITCATAYSLIAGLGLLQASLLLIGCLLVACAFVFSFMEIRRAVRADKKSVDESFAREPDPYASRTVDVAPPTQDAYPHHEDYVESQGLDQGQLTARISGSTPFIDRLFGSDTKKQESRG